MSSEKAPRGTLGASSVGVHAGAMEPRVGDPVVTPVYQSATFFWGSPGDDDQLRYTRYGNNPNLERLGRKIAAFEGADAALPFASGMGAIAATLLSLTEQGDHVVASRHLYGATYALLESELPRRGVTTTFVELDEPDDWRAAIRPKTRVLILEIPTNPALRVVDPAPLVELAREAGAHVVVDATFASPVNARLLDRGADVVVHSATKYLGGHSDLVAGVLSGSQEIVQRARTMLKLYGAVLDPHAAWLLERGLRTLALRMERHNENGLAVARWFEDQPEVARVLYPGLASHPDHDVATRLLRGYGGMVGIVLRGGGPAADAFCAALQLALVAPSLGGVETLVSQPRYTSHAALGDAERYALGIPDGFVRISVGVEDARDLMEDFRKGLTAAGRASVADAARG